EVSEVPLVHATVCPVRVKQPRSIQVVVFFEDRGRREYLLLRRNTAHAFWQSVTGSLEEGETHLQAAIRELREETGFEVNQDQLKDLDLVNRFQIAPQWRSKYAPNVTHNEEVCFAVKVTRREVRLDPLEHDAFVWADYAEAMELLYWESNRKALEAT